MRRALWGWQALEGVVTLAHRLRQYGIPSAASSRPQCFGAERRRPPAVR